MKQTPCARLDVFKSTLVRGAHFSQVYEFPVLCKSEDKPRRAIPFEKVYNAKDHNQWVHFYTHDRHFGCVWHNPQRYLPLFQLFAGVITPDFSLYREMPLVMQLWNTYRNRAIAFWLQREGVPIIPNVRWGDERTYAFAFEGLAQGGTVAVSTNGQLRSKVDRKYFTAGLARMVEHVKPQTIVNYSQAPEDIFGPYREYGIEIMVLPHYALSVRKEAA